MGRDQHGLCVHDALTSSTQLDDLFVTPIEVLSNTLKQENPRPFATQDLLEAYGVFAAHIKVFLHSTKSFKAETVPALEYLCAHAHIVSTCLLRDINRGLEVDLLRFHGTQRPSESLNLFGDSFEQDPDARLSSAVTHHALQLLSYIIGIPTLSVNFSGTSEAICRRTDLHGVYRKSSPCIARFLAEHSSRSNGIGV